MRSSDARFYMPRETSGNYADESLQKAIQELREQWNSMSEYAQQPMDANILAMKEEQISQKDEEIQTLEKQLGATFLLISQRNLNLWLTNKESF